MILTSKSFVKLMFQNCFIKVCPYSMCRHACVGLCRDDLLSQRPREGTCVGMSKITQGPRARINFFAVQIQCVRVLHSIKVFFRIYYLNIKPSNKPSSFLNLSKKMHSETYQFPKKKLKFSHKSY